MFCFPASATRLGREASSKDTRQLLLRRIFSSQSPCLHFTRLQEPRKSSPASNEKGIIHGRRRRALFSFILHNSSFVLVAQRPAVRRITWLGDGKRCKGIMNRTITHTRTASGVTTATLRSARSIDTPRAIAHTPCSKTIRPKP